MTTHEMARQLLALPDVQLVIEGWVDMPDWVTVVKMTGYDPEGTAIICQQPPNPQTGKGEALKCVPAGERALPHSITIWETNHPVSLLIELKMRVTIPAAIVMSVLLTDGHLIASGQPTKNPQETADRPSDALDNS